MKLIVKALLVLYFTLIIFQFNSGSFRQWNYNNYTELKEVKEFPFKIQ